MGYTDSKLIGFDEGIKLGYIDSKLIRTIVENLDGITLRIDFGKEIGSSDVSFDSSNDVKLYRLLLGYSMGSTYGKELESDGGIKLISNYSKVLGNILGDIDVITLGLDVGTELGCLDRNYDGSNNGKLEGLFIGGSLGSTVGNGAWI